MSVRFDECGNEYRIAEVKDGECLVWVQVLDDDGEAHDGELRIVHDSALHDDPPRRKLDDQIVQLQATREDLSLQIEALRKWLASFEDSTDERMAKLKRNKSLERLDDYLAGRITHYVIFSYGPPTIIKFEDTKSEGDGMRLEKMKLLTLFGRSNGDLEWGLNRYSDGSGMNSIVIPCVSKSEAVKAATELFAAHEKKAMDTNDHTAPDQRWVARGAEYGIVMSPEYLRNLKAREVATKQENIDKLELQLRELKA
ncbi:MAG: hypothetical protein IID41_00530 [Planctomycetes bacterium]|nr:hypothetical protein [Planctomycetota bacterium]